MRNFKIKKIAVLLLPIFLFGGLSFCFVQPNIANAETFDFQAPAQSFHSMGLCADNNNGVGAGLYSQKTNIDSEDCAKTKNENNNSLPLCCLDHNDTAKADIFGNQGLNNLSQAAVAENQCFDNFDTASYEFNNYLIGQSPPQKDFLSSIFKKE